MASCSMILLTLDFFQGNGGDKSCQFYVDKVREGGYVTLQNVAKRNLYLGMTEDGKVKPTIDSGGANTRFYPEVIECELKNEIF